MATSGLEWWVPWLALIACACDRPPLPEPSEVGTLPTATASTLSVVASSSAPASAALVPAAAASSATSSPPNDADATDAPPVPKGPTATLFETKTRGVDIPLDQLHFNVAFDGSQRFDRWADTLQFARSMRQRFGRPVHFTYFINSCFYDPTTKYSDIGRAHSWDEVLVRRALSQVAINEGHEIANHTVRHLDGSKFDDAKWERDFSEFHRALDWQLFEPIRDHRGGFVFPKFSPRPEAGKGDVGARCSKPTDCNQGQCIQLDASTSVCTDRCNAKRPCANGTICGTPKFRDTTDTCLPRPDYPVVHQGKELFNAKGQPNFKHPALKRYRIVGFRAPLLAINDALYRTLARRKYRYDASRVHTAGPPRRVKVKDVKRRFWSFGLMAYRGSASFPMDYNYRQLGTSEERVVADYRRSLTGAAKHHWPWNVGHHFSLWKQGAYWSALKRTVEYALEGCPVDGGTHACRGARLTNFRDLAGQLNRRGRAGLDRH